MRASYCRYAEPAKPRELLRLSDAHSVRSHLDGLEAGLRQHRKIETKELCVYYSRRVCRWVDVCTAMLVLLLLVLLVLLLRYDDDDDNR